MRRFSFSRGFSLLEILIVIAVVGLLATLAVLSLNSARARTRDAQRISDISILRTVLSQHYLETSNYPLSAGVQLGQPGTKTDVFTSLGFAASQEVNGIVYLQRVPTGPKLNEYYRYRGGANGYSLRFQTETDTLLGNANVYYAHGSGIDNKDDEK